MTTRADDLSRAREWIEAVATTDGQERTGLRLLDAALSAARDAALEEAAKVHDRDAVLGGFQSARWHKHYADSIRALQSAPAQVVPFEVADEWRQEMERLRAIVQGQRTGAILVSAADEVVSKMEVKAALLAHYSGQSLAKRRDLLDDLAQRLGVELDAAGDETPKGTRQTCTCLGTCKGADGLGKNWRCALAGP